MPNNNPSGVNAYSGPQGRADPAYGAIERLKVLSAIAPTTKNPALNAPRRAQKKASRKAAAPQSVPFPAPLPPQGQPVPYQAAVANFWQQLATEPGASDQVREYAAQVLNGAA